MILLKVCWLCGIRIDCYKLMFFYGDYVNEWELYDLKSDSTEMKNIYNECRESELIISLKTELKELQKQYNDSIVNEQF
ncbi:sulfatase/phosphatase domain-containing protein [Bacteroides caccae]|uniref:sulfatase/phosphatase domain-containing protein n=1 Tax=Bacteroides TaxID=816 RepID=UPI0035BBCA1C